MDIKFITTSFMLACASFVLSSAYAMESEGSEERTPHHQLKFKDVLQVPIEKQWIHNAQSSRWPYHEEKKTFWSLKLSKTKPCPNGNDGLLCVPPRSYVHCFTIGRCMGDIGIELSNLGYHAWDCYVKISNLNDENTSSVVDDRLKSRGILQSEGEGFNDPSQHKIERDKYHIIRNLNGWVKSRVFVSESIKEIAKFLAVFAEMKLIPDELIEMEMSYNNMGMIKIEGFKTKPDLPIASIHEKIIEKVCIQPVLSLSNPKNSETQPVPTPFLKVTIENGMPAKVLQTKPQTGCFYEQEPYPAVDDPYQSKPTVLSQDLLSDIFYNKNEEREFYKGGLVDTHGKPRNDRMQKMGDFIIDYQFRLGYGEKGAVWLAQHAPSKIFVAVKTVSPYKAPTDYPDVLSLQKLKRLYGLFKAHNHNNNEQTFIFMPLANGIPSTSLSYNKTFPVKATIQGDTLSIDQLDVGLNLISSFIKEVEYFAKSGYYQIDQQVGQVYVCNNFQSICIIDYDGEQRAQSIPETEWFVDPLRWGIINFLGIHKDGVFESSTLLPTDKISQLKQPKHLIDFFKAVDNNKRGPYSLAQLKLDFKFLKMGCDQK